MTIYYNFYLLDYNQGKKLPFIIGRNTKIEGKRKLILDLPVEQNDPKFILVVKL